jgi:hypothetical protein
MTEAVQELLHSFDALTNAEKQEATVQLLRRVVEEESGDVPEEALIAAAVSCCAAPNPRTARSVSSAHSTARRVIFRLLHGMDFREILRNPHAWLVDIRSPVQLGWRHAGRDAE